MKFVSLAAASRLYDCKADVTLEKHLVGFPLFSRFCFALRRIERAIGEHAEDEYWRPFLRQLRRYRFELTAAPLPGNHLRLVGALDLPTLRAGLRQCHQVYPQLAQEAQAVLELAEEMSRSEANPMADFLLASNLWRTSGEVALLIKAAALLPLVEQELVSYPNLNRLSVLSVHQVKSTSTYERLIVLGPGHWYPESVFLVPRAREVVVAHYKWIWDTWNPTPIFPTTDASQETISKFHTWELADEGVEESPTSSVADTGTDDDLLADVELLPVIDWKQLAVAHRAVPAAHDSAIQEVVEARLVLLEGDWSVFLDAEEGSSTLVIDLEAEDEERVRRVPVMELVPGMYVLQREGGGGDLIVTLADRILGREADRVRTLQATWKSKLRSQVAQVSLAGVRRALQQAGSPLASEANIRHWMAERSIRTHDYQDFAAIMAVVGMAPQASECWQAMGALHRAHKRAGHEIRKRLLRLVATADLAALERQGRMHFELKDVPSGGLTAWRVNDLAPEPIPISSHMVGEFFQT